MLTVGKLAAQTGITIRALHHYDELGLIVPSERSSKGYRLYNANDISRLQVVQSLQASGFSLKAIKEMLDKPSFSVREALLMHAKVLKKKVQMEQELCDRLDYMIQLLGTREHVPLEDVLHVLNSMNNVKQFNLDPEDEKKLQSHWASLSAADIKAVEAEWPKLIAEVRDHMQKGTDPTDPAVKKLATRWMELVNKFTGGIPAMHERTKQNWKENGDEIRAKHGDSAPDTEMFAYIQQAIQ